MDKDKSSDLIARYSGSGKIKLGKELTVPEGYVCLIVSKEKVLDRFTAGEYKLSVENIPATCRALKLNVPNKKGKYKKTFFADIYFVKLDEIKSQEFSSVQGIYVKKDKQFLSATVFVKGTYSFVVQDPVQFLGSLIKVFGIVKGSLAQRQLDLWVGELADKKIEKNKPSLDLLNERDSSCFEGLIDYLNKNMADIGIKFSQVEVTETILPKKIYKRTKLTYQEEHEFGKTETSPAKVQTEIESKDEAVLPDKSSMQNLKIDFEEDIENLNNDSNANSKPQTSSGEQNSSSTFMQPELNSLPSSIEEAKTDDSSSQNAVQDDSQDEIPEPAETIEEMQSKIAYKKCKYCGAINSKQAKICFECKNAFTKTCQKCGNVIENGDFVCPHCKSIVI